MSVAGPGSNLSVLGPIGGIVVAVGIFSACSNLLGLTVPLYMMQAYDRVLHSGSAETLLMLTVLAVACLLALAGFEIVRARLLARASSRLEYTLGPLVLESAVLAGLQRGSARSGQLLRDLQELRAFLVSPGFTAYLDAPWVPIYIALLWLIHPILGRIAFAGAVVLAVLGIVSEWIGRRPTRESRQAQIDAGRVAQTYIRNSDVIVAMGLMPAVRERWLGHLDSAFAPMAAAADRSGALSALARLARLLLQVAIIGAGVLLVLANELPSGVMIAATLLVSRAVAPLEQSISAWRALGSAREALARLRTALATLPPPRPWRPEPQGQLRVDGAAVLAPGTGRPLLTGITFALAPGEVLGVMGPSGAGKSTLARLLVGLERPVRGRVCLDGVDLEQWHPAQLGAYIGYQPQGASLFPGTVAENIAGLDPVDDLGPVVEAATMAGAHDMILSLPGGYGAQVGHDGELLSAGQRQRIGLARAFFGRRKLVVLDEPDAGLDRSGDAALEKAVAKARSAGCAVVLVTHRPDILKAADRVLLLKNGAAEGWGRAKGSTDADPASGANTRREKSEIHPSLVGLEQGMPRAAAASIPRSNRLYMICAKEDLAVARAMATYTARSGHTVTLLSGDDLAAEDISNWGPRLAHPEARTIAVLSPSLLTCPHSMAAVGEALDGDGLDRRRRLCILKVASSTISGQLGHLAHWDLALACRDTELIAEVLLLAADSKGTRAPSGRAAELYVPARRPLHPCLFAGAAQGQEADLLNVDNAIWSGARGAVIVDPEATRAASLARLYARQTADGYAGIWWLDGSTDAGLARDLASLDVLLRPGLRWRKSTGEAAVRTLDDLAAGDDGEPWLLIVAGLEDRRLLWRLPPGENKLLVTCSDADAARGLAICRLSPRSKRSRLSDELPPADYPAVQRRSIP